MFLLIYLEPVVWNHKAGTDGQTIVDTWWRNMVTSLQPCSALLAAMKFKDIMWNAFFKKQINIFFYKELVLDTREEMIKNKTRNIDIYF